MNESPLQKVGTSAKASWSAHNVRCLGFVTWLALSLLCSILGQGADTNTYLYHKIFWWGTNQMFTLILPQTRWHQLERFMLIVDARIFISRSPIEYNVLMCLRCWSKDT